MARIRVIGESHSGRGTRTASGDPKQASGVVPKDVGLVGRGDEALLRDELDADRRRGFVVSHGERYEGAVGVSAPVHDARERVVGDLIAT